MSLRPAVLKHLEKGKALGVQEGFVDTFNWMVDFINNLAGRNGIVVDKSVNDHPIIRMDGTANLGGVVFDGDNEDINTNSIQTVSSDSGDYVSLYGFDEGESQTASQISAVGVDSFDLLLRNRQTSGTKELQYFDLSELGKITNDGQSISVDFVEKIELDNVGIKAMGKTYTFENGLLKSIGQEKVIKTIPTSSQKVVSGSSYSTANHQFNNTCKTVTVLGIADADSENVFTAVEISQE